MPLCCVRSCLLPGERFVRFPLADVTLFRQWLEKINNPQLFHISPQTVYRCHKVCERHFKEGQLCIPYAGSTHRSVVPGACPSLLLNEEIGFRREDILDIRLDHTYTRIEVNSQTEPTTVAELCITIQVLLRLLPLHQAHAKHHPPDESVERAVDPLQPTTRLFLHQQLREHHKNKHGRRFTLDEKIIALSLLKRMRGAYKLMEKYFVMPSVVTLRRVLAKTPFRPGVNVALQQHLMAGIRNNLLTKDLHFILDDTQYRASWQDIVKLYNYDCTGTVVRCPSLNDFNVLPHKIRKMSVKNSAQVFSRTVYAGLQNLLDERSPDLHGLPPTASGTAKLINFMDQLFDSVNGARNPDEQVRELRRPLSEGSKHIEFWNKARQILHTMKFVKRPGNDPGGRVPSLTNWIVTLNGFLYLWKSLKHVGFNSLDLRAFNQDPLENFFGSIRSHLGANRIPTCASFVSSFRTLCINNLVSARSAGANCEQDDDVALTNLKSFLSEDVSGLSTSSLTSDETIVLDTTYQRQWDTAPTTYVFGYVARKLMKLNGVSTCTACMSQLLTTDTLPEHSFIADMELIKDRLTRPNTNFTKRCKALMDTTLRLLPLHGHKRGIMKLIKGYINSNHVVPSFSCEIHDVTNAFERDVLQDGPGLGVNEEEG
ncbi:hypothetical protein CBL_08524 [Carabus blaptoides fortunei]